MTHIYLVCKHRLASARYQGDHRKTPAYERGYEVVFATTDKELANKRKSSGSRWKNHFRYSVLRVMVMPSNADVTGGRDHD